MVHSTRRAILERTTRFAFRAVVDACRFRAFRASIFAANIFFFLLFELLEPFFLKERERERLRVHRPWRRL
jgi:hypothetical protein